MPNNPIGLEPTQETFTSEADYLNPNTSLDARAQEETLRAIRGEPNLNLGAPSPSRNTPVQIDNMSDAMKLIQLFFQNASEMQKKLIANDLVSKQQTVYTGPNTAQFIKSSALNWVLIGVGVLAVGGLIWYLVKNKRTVSSNNKKRLKCLNA